ncbi:MAG: DNA repair protein RecN [Candidatus Saccharicenans subterraneus]|uniref:DNA repair protein RecN n=1 Tax=Candidatus Saccharicenans subterraneus TaxID=2508984 RepID=A0A3E2BJ24_9BACT|nr:MAG: DNA repair protein RecN [Candidatus Saccharicenans subterraneum]
MIRYLRIKNLATIEDLELELESGFTILTGETGAGKSIIIDALKLLLGEKAQADLIRTGKDEASIEAVFEVQDRKSLPEDLELENGNQLFLQRIISSQGLSKSYLNGLLVPLKKLKELGELLIDIYGQNDHIFLLDTSNHLKFLDDFAEAAELKEKVRQAASRVRALIRQREELTARQKERAQRLDFINFQVKEIEQAGLRPGEDEELLQERAILKNSEKIAILVNQAIDISYESEESLVAGLKRVENIVSELQGFFPELEGSRLQLADFNIYLKELAGNLIDLRDRYAPSPERLEEIEERLSLIEKLKRKYGPSIEEILAHLENIRKEKEELEKSEEKLSDLEREIKTAFEDYRKLCSRLSRLRQERAVELEQLIVKELAQLAMSKARFKVEFRPLSPSLENPSTIRDLGAEELEFILSPNPGEELRPLRRIASGGELSRIMLAFKSLGKEAEKGRTLIFDEIDSGIGGKTADFVARKLQQLARRHQVLCITHLPQIASAASHHFRIEKKTEKDRTFTLVKKLRDRDRPEEIARLIAGTRLTEASLQMARELLEQNAGRN